MKADVEAREAKGVGAGTGAQRAHEVAVEVRGEEFLDDAKSGPPNNGVLNGDGAVAELVKEAVVPAVDSEGEQDVPFAGEAVAVGETLLAPPEMPTYYPIKDWRPAILFLTLMCITALVLSVVFRGFWWFLFVASLLFYWFGPIAAGQGFFRFLNNRKGANVRDTIGEDPLFEQMRCTRPIMWLNMECYHYRTTRNSKGERRRKKVVTARENAVQPFAAWEDVSGAAPRLADVQGRFLGVAVTAEAAVIHADPLTTQVFADFRRTFIERYRYRDTHHHFSEGVRHPGFAKSILLIDDDRRPWYVSRGAYTVSALLFLSWPYTLMLQRLFASSRWILRQKVSVSSTVGPESTLNHVAQLAKPAQAAQQSFPANSLAPTLALPLPLAASNPPLLVPYSSPNPDMTVYIRVPLTNQMPQPRQLPYTEAAEPTPGRFQFTPSDYSSVPSASSAPSAPSAPPAYAVAAYAQAADHVKDVPPTTHVAFY